MSIAAVGAQYGHGNPEAHSDTAYYDIAKHYFDDIVHEGGLDAIKVCILLSMYNIFEKSTVALAYIGMFLFFTYTTSPRHTDVVVQRSA